MACARGQQDRPGRKTATVGSDDYGVPYLDLHDLLAGKDLCVFQCVAHHKIHKGLSAYMSKAGIVFHHRSVCHLAAKGITFYNDGP